MVVGSNPYLTLERLYRYLGTQVLIKKTKGIWDKTNLTQSVRCIGFIENNVLTGIFKGQLFVWTGNRLQ